ncbi:MAG: hypothetical protein ACFB6R_01495 [Alphaproteobacteria bacterium]
MRVWRRIACAAVFMAAGLCLPNTLTAQSVSRPSAELADLYRRVDIDLDQHFREAWALWQHFEATYLPDDIPFPLTGRRAVHNEDDIREYLSEMRKARGAHRNNATVAGRLNDWPVKMAQWARLNARLSLARLWEIKIFDAQHALGLIARDARAGLEAARSEVEGALASATTEDAREAILADFQARERRRGAVLVSRVRVVVEDLAQWRARLAGKTWRWVHFLNETGPETAAAPFRSMLYDSFGVALKTRHEDPLDPLFGTDLPRESMLNWLGDLEADPAVLSLEILRDPQETIRLPLDLTGAFVPVEDLDPVRLAGPAAPATGSAARRAATSIAGLVEAIEASKARERSHMFRLLAALDAQPAPAELVDRTKAHLARINETIAVVAEPVEFAAKAAAAAAERNALRQALQAARQDEPSDPDRIADLEADLATRQSFVDRLEARAERAREAFAQDEELADGWAKHRDTNRTLRQAWQDLGHARLAGILALWPEDLPALSASPAAFLLDLEDTAAGLTRFLKAAAPAVAADLNDAAPAIEGIAHEDRHQYRLARELLRARMIGARLAVHLLNERAPDAAQPEAFLADAPAAAAKRAEAALNRFEALLAGERVRTPDGKGATGDAVPAVPEDQVQDLTIRLAALQRQDAPGRRGRKPVALDPAAGSDAWGFLERLAKAHDMGWPVAGTGALVLDDALVREDLDRLETLRRRLRTSDDAGSDVSALIRALTLRPLAAAEPLTLP